MLAEIGEDSLKKYLGKTIEEIATERQSDPEETIVNFVLESNNTIGAVAPEGAVLEQGAHPRGYGNFARLLVRYVRDEKVISLEEAIRKLTSLPAGNLKIPDRGLLTDGDFADVVVFDPDTITDHATFAEPHQLSTGVSHVFVNGVQVLKDGAHTGALPGRVVRGPGYKTR